MSIITLKPRNTTYTLTLSVHDGDDVKSVRIESETPPATFAVGDRVWLGDLDGFPESRLTIGEVRGVRHVMGGNVLRLTHDIVVDIAELSDAETGIAV